MIKFPYFLLLLVACILTAIPVSAYDFTLSVYGNANMDDIIDENDVTYLKGIISGVNEKTQFADANYDGIVNEDDISQIESIIAGDKVKLTFIDNGDEIVTIDSPVDNVATLFFGPLRPVIHLGSTDKIVGIGSKITGQSNPSIVLEAIPSLKELPEIGSTTDPSTEAIVSVNPDIILGTLHTDKETARTLRQHTNKPFAYVDSEEGFTEENSAFETWRRMGLILGKNDQNRAEELIRFCDEKISQITDITSTIPENQKPRVYLGGASADITGTTCYYMPIEIAGGINVASEAEPNNKFGNVDVSKEQIVAWNPDIILIHCYSKTANKPTVEEVLSDPALQTINAVKNKQVYNTKAWFAGWDPATGLCECYYLAKLFYPDLFKDLNVEKECNEILEELYGVSGLYDWMLENCGDYVTWR